MRFKTLLLDPQDNPIEVISWKRAITLLFKGKAEIVLEHDDDDAVIRSSNASWKIPSIMRQVAKCLRKPGARFSRYNVFLRDNFCCQYCGIKKRGQDLTFDHVIPKCEGGLKSWTNIVSACLPCNQKKSNRNPQEAGMKLLTKPFKPSWTPILTLKLKDTDPQAWRDYLYWHTPLEEGM